MTDTNTNNEAKQISLQAEGESSASLANFRALKSWPEINFKKEMRTLSKESKQTGDGTEKEEKPYTNEKKAKECKTGSCVSCIPSSSASASASATTGSNSSSKQSKSYRGEKKWFGEQKQHAEVCANCFHSHWQDKQGALFFAFSSLSSVLFYRGFGCVRFHGAECEMSLL
jgi:hypothetical protein